jgi:hypothetical protein
MKYGGTGYSEGFLRDHVFAPESMTVRFLDRFWSPAELFITALCVAGLVFWVRRIWKEAAAGARAKTAWMPTAYLILLDPEILFFALVSFAFSCLPVPLLYFAGTYQKTNGALSWIGLILGSRQRTMTLPPLTPEVVAIALALIAGFGLCFLLAAAGARVMTFGAVYTAHRRIAGGSPNILGTSFALLRRLPSILLVLADFRRTAGVEGAFAAQYLMCRGEDARTAVEHSVQMVRSMGGGSRLSGGVTQAGIRFAPVRTSSELVSAFTMGFVPAWLLSFYVAFGLGPSDSLPWILFGLFGTLIGYGLAGLNLMSFLNSIYLTAVFSRKGETAGSPLLANYDPRHLTSPFA